MVRIKMGLTRSPEKMKGLHLAWTGKSRLYPLILLLVMTLSFLTYLPLPSRAVSTQMIDFVGHGNNHGVGLCMAGVKGAAYTMSHESILAKYYTGIGYAFINDDAQQISVKQPDGSIVKMSLRQYLYRNGEEPDVWIPDNPAANQEALRALVVAARTYALYKILYGPHKAEGYDIIAGGSEQAFGFVSIDPATMPNTMQAVDATYSKFVTYDGSNPIIAAYHGSCGGFTASFEDTWPGGSTPAYLRGVPCGFCTGSQWYNWTKSVPASAIEGAYPTIGTFYSLSVESRNGLGDWGGRVKYVVIGGSAGSVRVPGYSFAKALGQNSLPSAYFTFTLHNRESFNEITGMRNEDKGVQYYLPWYDAQSPGMQGNWLLFGNPTTDPFAFSAEIPTLRVSRTLSSNETYTPTFSGVMSGPVEVVSDSSKTICSQRVLYKGSFNEVMGTREEDLGTKYYFTWYDSQDMKTWVLVGNPAGNPGSANVDIYIAGIKMGSYSIEPGGRITPTYPGVMNGPVEVRSTNGVKVFCSQRALFKDSFNEVMGTREEDLGTKYYFTWYDYQSPGMNGNWVLVGNPSASQTANVEIYVDGALGGNYSIPPGGRIIPTYPGAMNGPVTVRSTNGVKVFCSQRVLYKDSFNEVMGTREEDLGTKYYFTWYDYRDMKTWVLVGNSSTSQRANVEVYVHGTYVGSYWVPPSGIITPTYQGVVNGPVEVRSTNGVKVFCSQRALFKDSFNEVMGTREEDLGTKYYFTWYDYQSPGMNGNWVLVSNAGPASANTAIHVRGVTKQTGAVGAFSAYGASFPGVSGGPVELSANNWLIPSQRLIYRGAFNETPAIRKQDLSNRYYFPWYDQQSAGMTDWICVSNPESTSTAIVIKVAGVQKASRNLLSGESWTTSLNGLLDGPVEVYSKDGKKFICSQRVLYQGSYEEILGTAQEKLSSKYYFSWYDCDTNAGMQCDFIMIGNCDSTTATVTIKIGRTGSGIETSTNIGPGKYFNIQFPGIIAGPVEITALGGQKLVVSQRVVYKDSFNELPGVRSESLGTYYYFPWYDNASPGMTDWLVIANTGSATTTAVTRITGVQRHAEVIPPGEIKAFTLPGSIGGLVEVYSTNNQKLVVSQRVVYKGQAQF